MTFSISAASKKPTPSLAHQTWSQIIDARCITNKQFATIIRNLGYEAWAADNIVQQFGVKNITSIDDRKINIAMQALRKGEKLTPAFRFVLEHFDAVIAEIKQDLPKKHPLTDKLESQLKSTLEAIRDKPKEPSRSR